MGEMWFGHYRLDRLLGSGGTGQVWLARDADTDRDVALKILAGSHAADATYRQRFTREARLAAQVPGPHVAPIHSFGELDGRLYIDMEFIEGIDVAALLLRDGPMPPETAVAIIAQTAAALDTAHRAGLVHRDVKPSNIMVGSDGFVHLIDFGIARRIDQPALTASGNVVGTLAYMAPERFSGTADSRVDQYSLACVLYECLTGQRPFGNLDYAQQLRAHLMVDPPRASALNPALSSALDEVIARGMAKDPEQRWASAGELASAAYAAVTGREATTVEILAATRPMTDLLRESWRATEPWRTVMPPRTATPRQVANPRLDSERRPLVGPGLAAAAVTALFAVIAAALWMGRPGGAEIGAAVPSSEPPTSVVPGPAPQISAPLEPSWAPIPAAGQPCNPDIENTAVARDGTPLACVPAGRIANWTPAQPAHPPQPGDNQPSLGNSGSGNSGTGKPDSANSGNGKPGNDKPRKPNKQDK